MQRNLLGSPTKCMQPFQRRFVGNKQAGENIPLDRIGILKFIDDHRLVEATHFFNKSFMPYGLAHLQK